MATLLLNKTNIEENKEFSDILNTVDINNKEVKTLLLNSQSIANRYKVVSEVINSVNTEKKDVRKKSMKSIMRESFFHGASWLGQNFIA